MLVGSSVRISSVGCESADVGGSCVPFQTTVTYLGVHLDQTLSVKRRISSPCRTTFLALRRTASIRPLLSDSSIEKLVASMITSRLDNCTATFAGVADEQIARMQKIQKNAARLILKKTRSVIMSHRFWTNSTGSQLKTAFNTSSQRSLSVTLTHSSAIPVFFSQHISTIALPSFFDRKTAQNSKNKPENLRWTFFWLQCSDCLELAAGRPESFSLPPSFQS